MPDDHAVQLHRVLATTPEKLYRAFLERDAMAKWLPPDGFVCMVRELDGRPGGRYAMAFRNFTTGLSHGFSGEYVELVPYERIRYVDRFDDPNLPGEIRVTVTFRKTLVGTELRILQEGLPTAIPLESCYLGWQQSLNNLARLVEPDIRP